MLEVEMKFPVPDFASVERRLAELSACADEACPSSDHYFNAPDRDFAVTDEAFRLRRLGPFNTVTYKGPKRDVQAKVRTEIEVELEEGDEPAEDFLRLVQHLGYRPAAVVKKVRRTFHLRRGGYSLEVCLDEVEGVGRFVEVEILAPGEELERASAVLERTARELGLDRSERRSYLEMLLARNQEAAS